MGRFKEIYMEMQNKYGEDVIVTEQLLEDFLKEREEEKELFYVKKYNDYEKIDFNFNNYFSFLL